MQSRDNRCAPGGLGGVNPGDWPVLDQTDGLEFLKRLGHFGQDRAACGRHDNMLGQTPAELLGNFKAIGFGAFGVIRPDVDVHERPAVLVGNLAAQPVDIVVVAVDGNRPWAIDR